MSASWYDVLGVSRDASTEQIRDAWRDAIADFDPTDRRFGLYNDAAKVLLDAEARAAYDLTLPEPEPEPAAESDSAAEPELAAAPTEAPDDELADDELADDDLDDVEEDDDEFDDELEEIDPNAPDPRERPGQLAAPVAASTSATTQRAVPAWLLIALALATLVCAGVASYFQFASDDSDDVEDAVAEARSAASQHFGDVLTYRWDDLEGARKRAAAILTPSYYESSFAKTWSLVQASAKEVKAVVTTTVLATGVVRASDDAQRVELVAVLRNEASNAAGDKGTGFIMVGLTMVEKGGSWLVDDITGIESNDAGSEGQDGASSPGAPTPSAAPSANPQSSPAE